MGKIHVLDSELANKIAAGEVVERPASVVKELVENAIDAGADSIEVEIKNGGSRYIRVTDNGVGMSAEDAATAFLRHATSKIQTNEDLDAIYTLGFRGEALSSIGAVAEVNLYTKQKGGEYGSHVRCRGGEIVSSEDAGAPEGTTFIVQELFFNTPARQKFLKKDAAEAGYITDIMTRFILAYPEITFKYKNNGKEALYSSGNGNLTDAVYAVYGRDYAKACIPVDYNDASVHVHGVAGKGGVARANRSYQSFFVNKRYVKSPMMMKALEEAYKNVVMIGKHPMAVLNLDIDPRLIDINVHPTKQEVKFSNEGAVYRSIYYGVKNALYSIMDIPPLKDTPDDEEETGEERADTQMPPIFAPEYPRAQVTIDNTAYRNPAKPYSRPVNPYMKSGTSDKTVAERAYAEADFSLSAPTEYITEDEPPRSDDSLIADDNMWRRMMAEADTNAERAEMQKTKQAVDVMLDMDEHDERSADGMLTGARAGFENRDNVRLIGQLFKTYIIAECGDEMLLIDQHAAHERINYETFLRCREGIVPPVQWLLTPIKLELTESERIICADNTDRLGKMGFSFKINDDGVYLTGLPMGLTEDDMGDIITEILTNIDENKTDIIPERVTMLLYSTSCKHAIKANQKISEREMMFIIEKIFELDNINTCPHGRPIITRLSKKEIEKNFKRI